MYLADGYFADSFADADDIVTFGDVNGVFAIRLFQLDFLDTDAYYTVYFQLASDGSILHNDLVVVGADFDRIGFCLFYGMRCLNRLLRTCNKRGTNVSADQQDYGK